MSSKYRRLYALLGLVVLWGVYRGLQHFGMTHPNREHAMIEPLRDMQTFCIGRFLIDLPRERRLSQQKVADWASDSVPSIPFHAPNLRVG